MYERRCAQAIDEPVLVWMGLEFREVAISFLAGMGTAMAATVAAGLLAGILAGPLVGAAFVALFQALRKGVVVTLYRWRLFEFLPNLFRPRYLLPIPSGARTSRLRLSAVPEENLKPGPDYARRYFGI